MKQTAVEWLVEKLDQNFDYVADTIIEQAKEMEKQQIIDACVKGFCISAEGFNGEYGINDFNNIKEEISAEQYYTETYGSKGSDGNFKQFSLYEHKETIATADTPTSSQTEISDEEMMYSEDDVCNFVEWMNLHYRALEHTISLKDVNGTKELLQKWYREQLKNNIV